MIIKNAGLDFVQDGGIGRHASPPHTTTKKRITTKSQNK